MLRVFVRLAVDDEGQDLIEYGLLAALISILAVATLTSMGQKLDTFFSAVSQAVP